VYWDEEGVIDGFSKQSTKSEGVKLVWEPVLRHTPEIEGKFDCSARGDFAVGAQDEFFYVGYEHESVSEECPGENGEAPDRFAVAQLSGSAPLPAVLTAQLDRENTTGAAVDQASGVDTPLGEAGRGEVYLDNGDSVAVFTPSGLLAGRFGAGELSGGAGIAVDSHSGDVFVAESAADEVLVFTPEETPAAPVVDGVSAQGVSPESERLSAQIDPRGAETEYYFQYGSVDCAVRPDACVDVGVGKLAAGFGDQGVTVEVGGLAPATAYYYRVLASSAVGAGEGVPSLDTFTTLASASVLPDGRAWEMVSPPEKHGAAVEEISPARRGVIQAAAGGGAIAWLASGPLVGEPEGSRSFEPTPLISRRGPDGWQTQSLETPHYEGRGILDPSPSEYRFFSPELSLSLVAPTEPAFKVGEVFEHPPLSAQASEKTLYLREEHAPGPAGFVPLVDAGDDTAGTKFGNGLEFLGATSDLGHVVFESKVALTAAWPSAAGLYEWEAQGAALQLLSVLPDGLPAPDGSGEAGKSEPVLGDGGGLNSRDAISSDGTRVLWSEEVDQVPQALYLRDTESGETIQVSAAQGHGATEPGVGGAVLPEPAEGRQEVHFQSASSDGSRVLFTDTARLAEESSEEPVGEEAPTDLYEFQLTSGAGEPLRGRLTDLTPDSTAGSADVLNLIPGASQNGELVYFVANGVLAAGATPGGCVHDPEEPAPPAATCNLYVSEPDPQDPSLRETRFIAALSGEDAADWGAGFPSSLPPAQQNLSAITSSVSPDGRYLAFMSQQSLTGYDNDNAIGGQPAEEVYLYDAASGRLVCASCNPNSENGGFKRPVGVFDTELAGEGIGLLVDRPELWKDRWLAGSIPGWTFNGAGGPSALYQPRYLSDTGRLFFDSSDALVPADQNGKEDVYEYEPEGVGSCRYSSGCIGLISSGSSSRESAFLDASENGDDVFFLTAAQLVPQDTDNTYDIYDARVCSEAEPCLSSKSSAVQECETTGTCRPSSTTPSQLPAAPSATYSGPGNVTTQSAPPASTHSKPKPKALTRAQKLAAALKACRKLKRKHKRAICETQARKRYAPKPKPKAKGKR
jgi:hypothetical protein